MHRCETMLYVWNKDIIEPEISYIFSWLYSGIILIKTAFWVRHRQSDDTMSDLVRMRPVPVTSRVALSSGKGYVKATGPPYNGIAALVALSQSCPCSVQVMICLSHVCNSNIWFFNKPQNSDHWCASTNNVNLFVCRFKKNPRTRR